MPPNIPGSTSVDLLVGKSLELLLNVVDILVSPVLARWFIANKSPITVAPYETLQRMASASSTFNLFNIFAFATHQQSIPLRRLIGPDAASGCTLQYFDLERLNRRRLPLEQRRLIGNWSHRSETY
jgi:hypothetical protein